MHQFYILYCQYEMHVYKLDGKVVIDEWKYIFGNTFGNKNAK